MTTTKPLTATLTRDDAWGRAQSFKVTWQPLEVTGYDAARENVGIREWAFGTPTTPPIRLIKRNGLIDWAPEIKTFTGNTQQVIEFTQVSAVDEVEPGTFFVHNFPDEAAAIDELTYAQQQVAEATETLERALERRAESFREALADGLSRYRVAQIVGLTPNAVKSALAKRP